MPRSPAPRTGSSRSLPADVTVAGGAITAAEGYDVLTGNELVGIDQELAELVVPAGGDSFVRPEGLSTALELTPTLRYDEQADTFTNIETGVVFRTTARARTRPPTGRADRAGMADEHRPRELQGDLHEPADPRSVPLDVRLDVRLRGAVGACSRSSRGSSSRSR